MTVKELIKELSKHVGDTEVVAMTYFDVNMGEGDPDCDDYEDHPITCVHGEWSGLHGLMDNKYFVAIESPRNVGGSL